MKRPLLPLLAVTLLACGGGPTAVSVITGPNTRYLPAVVLTAGQRLDISPDYRAEYDSLPVLSSQAVAFLAMQRVTLITNPDGGSVQVQQYHFRASAPGRTVATLVFSDGSAALQDTIDVEPAIPHGNFAQISTGFFLKTCAVATNGTGYCWGGRKRVAATTDTFKDAAMIYDNTPMSIASGLTFTAISRGATHACGVTSDGAAYCWGDNTNGDLGDGSTDASTIPVPVTGGLTFKAVSAGVYHTCGLTTHGAIYCWGNDHNGELGNGSTSYNNPSPVLVSSDSSFITVGAGYQYSCGVTRSGAAYCWGRNSDGELGDGNLTSSSLPVLVSGGHSFAALSAGYFHACGLTSTVDAYCWGRNTEGQLGDGTTQPSSMPVPVGRFARISAGQYATCGIKTGGAAYCWGYNGYGQLGSASTPLTKAPNPLPLLVSGGLDFSAISTGYYHTCGVTTQSVAYCWGDNSLGELGDGSTAFHPTPVRVFGQ